MITYFNKQLSKSIIIFSSILVILFSITSGCSKNTEQNEFKSRHLARDRFNPNENYNDNNRPIDSFSFYGEDISAEKEQELLTENIVYFAYDKDEISYRYELVLLAHAKKMLEVPTLRLRIDGHTDERGSAEYNIALGERRANAVIRFMKFKGVPRDRLVSLSYGKEKPAVKGHNEEAWRLNRRAELIYE